MITSLQRYIIILVVVRYIRYVPYILRVLYARGEDDIAS